MLHIKNISKQYKTGDLIQIALNDVSLSFRDNEFGFVFQSYNLILQQL